MTRYWDSSSSTCFLLFLFFGISFTFGLYFPRRSSRFAGLYRLFASFISLVFYYLFFWLHSLFRCLFFITLERIIFAFLFWYSLSHRLEWIFLFFYFFRTWCFVHLHLVQLCWETFDTFEFTDSPTVVILEVLLIELFFHLILFLLRFLYVFILFIILFELSILCLGLLKVMV